MLVFDEIVRSMAMLNSLRKNHSQFYVENSNKEQTL